MTTDEHQVKRADVDVAIVGGGLSGLTAAHRLSRTGLSVVVLEASGRLGGRTLDLEVADGVVTEGGGQWIGGLHTRVFTLIEELGLKTFDTHTVGRTIYRHRGKQRTYKGTNPPLSALAMADFAQAQVRLELMARNVPAVKPWTARKAVSWDGTTLGHWLDANCRVSESRHLFTLVFTMVFCQDPHRISLLKVLHQLRTSGGLAFMMNTEYGAQESRVVGGAQTLSTVIAAGLGNRVVLDSPVTAIDQDRSGVLVRSARAHVRCRRAIVAMAPGDADRISFSPGLPTRRATLQRIWHSGSEAKLFAVYDRPFWRDRGLSGTALTDLPLAHYVVDNSPPKGEVGILLAFVGTNTAGPGLRWSDSVVNQPGARQAALLKDLATLFGPEASRPRQVLEQSWVNDPWISGCVGTYAPGMVTSYTDAVTAPVGRIHWAGTEAATEFTGYLEGAVRAGQRAADEASVGLPAADVGRRAASAVAGAA